MIETFLKHYKSSNTSVTILERVDSFKTMVEVKNILKSYHFLAFIIPQQFTNSLAYQFRLYRLNATHLIWKSFVFANSKPRLRSI